MKKVKVIVEHAGENFSAYIENLPITTTGKTLSEIKVNMLEAIDLYLDDNENPDEILEGEFELEFQVTISNFLKLYKGTLNKKAISRISGINTRMLWHYSAESFKPRKKQNEKLQEGIDRLVAELSNIKVI